MNLMIPTWLLVVVIAATVLFIFLIGFIIGRKYEKSALVGTLVVENREDREAYTWVFDKEFEDMAGMSEFRIRVDNRLPKHDSTDF